MFNETCNIKSNPKIHVAFDLFCLKVLDIVVDIVFEFDTKISKRLQGLNREFIFINIPFKKKEIPFTPLRSDSHLK